MSEKEPSVLQSSENTPNNTESENSTALAKLDIDVLPLASTLSLDLISNGGKKPELLALESMSEPSVIELPEHMSRTTVDNNESDTEVVSSEEKQTNDGGASSEVASENIDMSKRQPESVESELEGKFEGLWEAGDKVGAMEVALGRRVDSQEVMNDKMLGLALLSPNPKEAYGVLLVHRAFSSEKSEKA
ncbi:MAG: hypothetical protein WA087_02780 [Candidatus Saccharimonadales bacterium]